MSDLDPQQVPSRATGHFQPCFPTSRPVSRSVFVSKLGYGDVSVPMSLGLHFLGQQLPWGPNGEFESLIYDDVHWYRKCNAPVSLEELTGQHAST